MSNITVTKWSEDQFLNSKGEWDSLVGVSKADQLFMSWDWLSIWWQTWKVSLGLSALVLAAYDRKGQLVGLAPLYHDIIKLRGIMDVDRIQFMGNCFSAKTMRTEYVDFIVKPGFEEPVINAFLEKLEQETWDLFLVSDMPKSSKTYELLINQEFLTGVVTREVNPDKSYYINSTGSFEEYLSNLGRNTRLKMYNRRTFLEQLGEVEINYACDESEVAHYFDILNKLHKVRWNKDCFAGQLLEFHQALAVNLLKQGALRFSLLSLSGEPLSVLYDFKAGHSEYNIQAGFNDKFNKKLSIGTLHLGYAVEQAFKDNDVKAYNLLAGEGKATQYKLHFSKLGHDFTTLQLLRSRSTKTLYGLYGLLPEWIKAITARLMR